MKRLICGVLIAVLILPSLLLCGCRLSSEDDGKLTVVVTVFPAYDWARNILGDRLEDEDVELILMTDDGSDMHSYQPTFDDRISVTSCDLLIYVGGTDDAWVEEAMGSATHRPATIHLLNTLGDQVKHVTPTDGTDHHEGDGHLHEEVDEHVWLSLRNAATLCDAIANQLTALDPVHGITYQKNAGNYIGKLNVLDGRYSTMAKAAVRDTVLFGDRFPFRYLLDDYGIRYLAAFSGCSADTSASFETVTHLAGKVNELGLPCVLTVAHSDGNIAASIVANTTDKNQAILVMDAMQTVTASMVASGVTYLGIMETNLDVLTSALH